MACVYIGFTVPELPKAKGPVVKHQRGAADLRVAEYLMMQDLDTLYGLAEESVRGLMRRGHLVRGRHYQQPTGKRGRLLFKRTAIEAWLGRSLPDRHDQEAIREQVERYAEQMFGRAARP